MNHPTTTTTTSADPLVAAAAARLPLLAAGVRAKVTAWTPQLEQRQMTAKQWDAVAPLVLAAAVCANPKTPPHASQTTGVALSMVLHAQSRRAPLRSDIVFRQSTGDAYLNSIDLASTRRTHSSIVANLVGGVKAALANPTPPVSPTVVDVDDASVGPLLQADTAPSVRALDALGLNSEAGTLALDALALVRARVLELEPAANRSTERLRGKGRAIPYGDVEVVALLAAAQRQRTAQRRVAISATIALGVGAGLVADTAAMVKATDISTANTTFGPVTVINTGGRLVPVHAAFTGPILRAAAVNTGWLLGGGQRRHARVAKMTEGLEASDPHLVRLNSARLRATWLAMHATLGTPLGDLIAAAGWSTTTALTAVLPYIPTTSQLGTAALGGLLGLPTRADQPGAQA